MVFYSHRNYRFITMLRGSLVAAIYRKTTEISLTALDNSAAVTLMSTDVERIVMGLKMMHEFWANLIQVGIATWLLQRELGGACVAPIALTIGISPNIVRSSGTFPLIPFQFRRSVPSVCHETQQRSKRRG